jgi:hypothetical protein
VNLEDVYTVTNHAFFHPVYSWGTHVSLAEAMIIYAGSSLPTQPDSFMFRVEEVWENVMARLATDDGDFVLPAGSDWTTHDYGQVPYLGLIATRLGRDDAAVLESRAIDNFTKYYDATMTVPRTGPSDDVGLQADVFRNIALDWWLHQLFGPAPDPDQAAYDAARAASDGAWRFPEQKTVIGRFDGTVSSMSWNFDAGDTWPTGLVVPSNAGNLADPALVNPWMTSAVDGANNSAGTQWCDCEGDADHFSTAATINSGTPRKFSMSAFADGTTLLLDRGAGATASFGFEEIPGFTGSRTVRSDSGTGVEGNLSGDWANIGNRFGLVVKGGSGLWADQGAGAGQPPLWLRGSLNTGSGHRGAAVFPNVTGTTTDALEPDVKQPTVSDSSWSALTAIAQNGTGKVAVARWGGGSSMTASGMASSQGVPIPGGPVSAYSFAADVPSPEVTVTGSTGSTSFTYSDNPESHGYEANFFVTASAGKTVTAKKVHVPSRDPYLLLHSGSSSNLVTVKYDGGPGSLQTASATLDSGQAAIAVVWAGTLRIAKITATSTEPPGTYHAKLAFDGLETGSSNFWVSDGANLATAKQCLVLDFGTAVTLGSLRMVPRTGYGPKDYKIYTGTGSSTDCNGTTNWNERVDVTNSGDGTPRTSSWSPVSAQKIRIRVGAAYGSGPPHFVQIRELIAAAS